MKSHLRKQHLSSHSDPLFSEKPKKVEQTNLCWLLSAGSPFTVNTNIIFSLENPRSHTLNGLSYWDSAAHGKSRCIPATMAPHRTMKKTRHTGIR